MQCVCIRTRAYLSVLARIFTKTDSEIFKINNIRDITQLSLKIQVFGVRSPIIITQLSIDKADLHTNFQISGIPQNSIEVPKYPMKFCAQTGLSTTELW